MFKSEVLFIERVYPFARPASLDDATLARLYERSRALLEGNLRSQARNTTGRRRPNLWVYEAGRRPCLRCGGRIESKRHGDSMDTPRVTWWCPRCQPEA